MGARIDPNRELPAGLRAAFTLGFAAVLTWLEFKRPLRTTREQKSHHALRNLLLASSAGLAMQLAERPLSLWCCKQVLARRWGIAPRLARSVVFQTALSVVMLDYGLYLWHVLTHRIPFLWRFHLVHHIDLDLDATTALRFHFGEMLLSVPWRLAQIFISGASPLAYSSWQTLLFASILFHHSNLKLSWRAERILARLIMTPRLHGVHHEPDRAHSNSNWSSGLAWWDLLHGTQRWGAGDGVVGVPAYSDPADVAITRSMILPFTRQRDAWVQHPIPHFEEPPR